MIATDVPSSLRSPPGAPRRMSLHEGADQAGMFRPVTKAVLGPATPASCATSPAGPARWRSSRPPARSACRCRPTSSGRRPPGPRAGRALEAPGRSSRAAVATGDPGAAARALAAARRPLVWAGGGALADAAGAAVAALARRLGAPVLTTMSARGLLGDDPLAVGLPPHVEEAGALWDAADAVVVVGSDLDGMSTQGWRQPQPPLLVLVDVDPAGAHASYRADHVLAVTAAAGCDRLRGGLGAGPDRAPWADLADVRARARAACAPCSAPSWGSSTRWRPRCRRARSCSPTCASRATGWPPSTACRARACCSTRWAGARSATRSPRRSARRSPDDGPTVAFCGDGGFLFACGELATVGAGAHAADRR